jgi:hypothetical protein
MFKTEDLNYDGLSGGYTVPCASEPATDHPDLKCTLQTDKPSTLLCERGE